jgi:hypothetical protein
MSQQISQNDMDNSTLIEKLNMENINAIKKIHQVFYLHCQMD